MRGVPELRLAALALLALGLGLLAAVPAARASSTPSPEVAVAQLNAWRALVGVGPVVHDDQLGSGCRSHAAYYGANPGATGHGEDASLPGYTEAGDQAARTSVLAYGSGSTRGFKDWEPAPYHRIALLEPRLAATGFWSEFGLSCMNVGRLDAALRTPGLVAYTYPFNGQANVATTFGCNERPNPCAAVPGNDGTGPTGSNLTLQFNGPWARTDPPIVTSAALATVGGASVAITVQRRDSLLRGAVVIIPHEPLTAGTTYVASASGVVPASADDGTRSDYPFAVSWSFSTPGTKPAASLKVSVERITTARVHLRLDLLSSQPRDARISLWNNRKALVQVSERIRAAVHRMSVPRPRERVTSIGVLLRGSATQIGVAARVQTDIAAADAPPLVAAGRAARSR